MVPQIFFVHFFLNNEELPSSSTLERFEINFGLLASKNRLPVVKASVTKGGSL
jgi:hypothetical protein